MRVGELAELSKTRVLAREGWRRRRCLEVVVVVVECAAQFRKGYCHVASMVSAG